MQHVVRSAPLLRSQITWKGCHVSFDSKLLRVGINKDVEAFLEEAPNANFWGYELVNSRYLDYGIKKKGVFNMMDSSISLLWNLQTFIVKGDDRVTIAPYEIWEMTQLRHLICYHVLLPDPVSSDEGNDMVLRNLQTFKDVVNLRLSDEVCKRIPNIKELKMAYFDDEAWSYCPHNLGGLHKLESLECVLGISPEWYEFAQVLKFPRSLKTLALFNLHLDWEEMTMRIGCLPLLEELDLEDLNGGGEWNPVEGGFPRLRSLFIGGADDLRNWNAESSHFPVLEHLCLRGVSKLDEFPCGIGEIPTLQRIDLDRCSVCLGVSALRIVVEQEDNGNDSLQLCVDFWGENNEKVERFNKIVQEEGLATNNLHVLSRT